MKNIKKTMLSLCVVGAGVMGLSATSLWAQTAPAAMPTPIPAPQNIAYKGVIEHVVDATDMVHRTIKVTETIPVEKSGDMVLLTPKWLPGHHSPANDGSKLSELKIMAGGKELAWRRDMVDVNGFHIDVPAGVKSIEVSFTYLSALDKASGKVYMAPDVLNIQWSTVSLYPAGYYTSKVPFHTTVIFPEGFGYATALDTKTKSGNRVEFETIDFDNLMDSPIYAGRYIKSWDIGDNVRLNVVADRPEQLDITPEALAAHKALVVQADKLYGARHFNHYDFLASSSEVLMGNGLEHHRSSEDDAGPKYLTDWKSAVGRSLLPHEYTHSWNGKFRRPNDLWTPNFQVPMRDSLLWVYEGQTQFWGTVLASRAGFNTLEQTKEILAATAANLDHLPAREWRDLADTTNDPIVSSRGPKNWRSNQRSEDYYNEGMFIWLEVDGILREKSGGTKSLDDFAHAFFGIKNGSWTPELYDFKDVVATLNSIVPYDWASLLNERLYKTGGGAPLNGFKLGGYRLIYTDKPSELQKTAEDKSKGVSLVYSLGLDVNKDAMITNVLWDSLAFKAGLNPDMVIVAVNGKAFSADEIKSAVTKAKSGTKPIELWVKSDDTYSIIKLDYHEGLKYPHLEKIGDGPASLDKLLSAK